MLNRLTPICEREREIKVSERVRQRESDRDIVYSYKEEE